MTTRSDEQIARFTAEVYRRAEKFGASGEVWPAVRDLPGIARRLTKVFERQCNGYQTGSGDWDEAAAKRDEAREARLTNRALELAAQCGARLYVQGDPRGWPLYLYWHAELTTDEKIDSCYSRRAVGVPC